MTQWVQDFVGSAGYAALAALMFLENIFPPIPSEIVLPLAGFEVGQRRLVFAFAVLAATAGSVAGALILRELGVHGGRALILRHGRLLRIDGKDLDRAEKWFGRWGSWSVFLGRMVPFVRSVVSVPAGTLKMPVKRFVLLTALGSGIWNAALIAAGQAVGRNWHEVSEAISAYAPWLVATLIGVLALVLLRKHRPARVGG